MLDRGENNGRTIVGTGKRWLRLLNLGSTIIVSGLWLLSAFKIEGGRLMEV